MVWRLKPTLKWIAILTLDRLGGTFHRSSSNNSSATTIAVAIWATVGTAGRRTVCIRTANPAARNIVGKTESPNQLAGATNGTTRRTIINRNIDLKSGAATCCPIFYEWSS